MKRYIYIIIGIIVLAVVAILAILLFKKQMNGQGLSGTTGTLPPSGTGPGTGTTGTIGGAPSSTTGTSTPGQNGVGAFNMFFAGPVLDYAVNAQNNITAIETNGAIVSIANGETTTLSSSTINDIISAQFSSDGRKVLVSFGDVNNPQAAVFDVPTQSWTMLPQGIESPSWLSSTYQIAYFRGVSSGVLTLWTLNLSTSTNNQPRSIFTLNAQDLGIDWINKNQMVFYDKPSIQVADSVWIFNITTKSLVPAAYEQAGIETSWNDNTTPTSTPEGLVFAGSSSGQESTLKLVDLSGKTLQNLNFATLPTKCLFNEEGQTTSTASTGASTTPPSSPSAAYTLMLYCGIPRDSSIFSGNQLPDSYNQLALFTADDIYKINTVTGEKDVLWNDQTQSMDVSDPKVLNNTFFFVNRYNQSLYGVSLGQ